MPATKDLMSAFYVSEWAKDDQLRDMMPRSTDDGGRSGKRLESENRQLQKELKEMRKEKRKEKLKVKLKEKLKEKCTSDFTSLHMIYVISIGFLRVL